MSSEAQFTVFCMESYKVYKDLTGKTGYPSFLRSTVYLSISMSFLMYSIPQGISTSITTLTFICRREMRFSLHSKTGSISLGSSEGCTPCFLCSFSR